MGPEYVQGQAGFHLHCPASSYEYTSSTEKMAEAAVALLRNLSEEELSFLGITTEAVSDSEEGLATFKIDNPMVLVGTCDREEIQGAAALMEKEELASTQAPDQPTSEATDLVLTGLKKLLERMVLQLQRADERSASSAHQLSTQAAELTRLCNEVADWKDRAKSFQEERDELRMELQRRTEGAAQPNVAPTPALAVSGTQTPLRGTQEAPNGRNSRAREVSERQAELAQNIPGLPIAPLSLTQPRSRAEAEKERVRRAAEEFEMNKMRWSEVAARGLPPSISDLPQALLPY